MDLKNLIPSLGRKNVPIRREEEHPFVNLQREMNRLFDGFLQGWDKEPAEGFGAFTPRIDMAEDEKSLILSAELPGMNDKDIEVSLSRDLLTIRGEKKHEQEQRRGNYFYSERSFGSFARTVRMPREVDADKVRAEFKKGILKITLPKTLPAGKETRKIAVTQE
jgi:HSP20 family protein